MLRITVPEQEVYDPKNNIFMTVKEQSLSLEHSLVSISKWEAKWHKPFFGRDTKTKEELLDYIKCMTLTQNVDTGIYHRIEPEQIKRINEYIDNPMSATTFSDNKKKGVSRQIITSEIIYYWMISLNIPFECQKWHINRLLTLIKVCSIKNAPKKKMSKGELMRRNRNLNAARRAALKTSG